MRGTQARQVIGDIERDVRDCVELMRECGDEERRLKEGERQVGCWRWLLACNVLRGVAGQGGQDGAGAHRAAGAAGRRAARATGRAAAERD